MVLYSSISCFIGSITTAFGELDDGTTICSAQGFISNTSFLSSVLWLLFVNYAIYSIFVLTRPVRVTIPIHLTCWGLPLLLGLLPFSTNKYGASGGKSWCFIGEVSSSPPLGQYLWVIFSHYLWIWISIIITSIFLFLIQYQIFKMKKLTAILTAGGTVAVPRKRAGVGTLWLYPGLLVFIWTIPSIVDTVHWAPHRTETPIDRLAIFLPLSQGFFIAVIFFTTTDFLRRKMYSLVTGQPVALESRGSNASVAAGRRLSSVVHVERRISEIPYEPRKSINRAVSINNAIVPFKPVSSAVWKEDEKD